ncbi:MAG TPA: iron uptake porin [Oculatellaceae cyanobacterium]|jgi:hypothetical protein
MILLRNSTNFLCNCLIYIISAATLASGATALPTAETLLDRTPSDSSTEVSKTKTEIKTPILDERQEKKSDQVDDEQMDVNPTENQPSAAPSPKTIPINQPDVNDLNYFNNSDPESLEFSQVTSVSQLSDVQPTDWAFQALQSIVERYGCLAGYPNGTFRGNTVLTRYEFAAGLNACLEQVRKLISNSTTTNTVNTEDLATLERLKTEFTAEVTTLKDRVNTLEERTAQLQANRFSTTSRLFGSVRFQANEFFSGQGNTEANLQYNVFLGVISSFTGRDLLITGFASTNAELPELVTNNAGRNVGSTREGTSDTAAPGSTGNLLRMISLSYQFPVSDKLSVTLIGGDRFRFNPVSLPRYLPYYQVGAGPVSAFAESPPIYGLGAGSGISLSYKILKNTELTLTYLAAFAGQSNSGSGLFNGDYVAAAQLNYNPSRSFFLQGLYQHGYFGTRNIGFGGIGNFAFNNAQFFRGNGFIGTALANRFDDEGVFFSEASSVSSNGYHVGGYYAISSRFIVGGWVDLINARLLGKGDANIWTYSIQAAFPDLFKPGNLGGLVVGMEPTLTGLRRGDKFVGGFDKDTSLHLEAYYRHQLTNNISLTPSVIWITAPNQDQDNEDIVIGGLRTTFSF